jgi:hypothetical protein
VDRSPSALTLAGAAVVSILAMVQLVTALTSEGIPGYARVLLLASCTLTSLAALLLHRDAGTGARLGALAAAVLSGAGSVLVGTVGLPGRGSSGFDGAETGTLGLALAVVLLLVLDARSRRSIEAAVPPYAL